MLHPAAQEKSETGAGQAEEGNSTVLTAPPEDLVEEWARARFLALTEESQIELILEYCDDMTQDTRRKVISRLMEQQFRDISYPRYRIDGTVDYKK